MGSDFSYASGATLINDPYPIELIIDQQVQKVLLSHGDLFCTDDTAYMDFRSMVRDPLWQQQFLAKTITERVAIARTMREHSIKQHTTQENAEISDVNQDAIEQIMLSHECKLLIYGHTHRPTVHNFQCHHQDAQRIVLHDWNPSAEALELIS